MILTQCRHLTGSNNIRGVPKMVICSTENDDEPWDFNGFQGRPHFPNETPKVIYLTVNELVVSSSASVEGTKLT